MNALVPVNTAPAMTVSDVERVANAIAKGGLFGSKDPNAVLTLCLLAQAEGQHPAVVFRDYHVINGKPAKKAEAMLRDFINAGGKVEWHQLDDTCADATFTHPAGNARIAWDHKRAQTAGLGSNQMYRKFPRQMLRSRVISEGIRTVYPGATSGLYEEGEVASFADPAPRAAAIEGDGPDAQREPIDITALDVSDTPEREKVPGITKIKNRLNAFMREGNKATEIEAFRALVKANKADLKTIRDANHSYWTGDSEDFEGFEKWMERRYAELAPQEHSLEYQLLVSTLNECTSHQELQSWLAKNGDVIGTLDGEESRKFDALYDERAAGLKLVATVSV
jgi:hypothetical protein